MNENVNKEKRNEVVNILRKNGCVKKEEEKRRNLKGNDWIDKNLEWKVVSQKRRKDGRKTRKNFGMTECVSKRKRNG